jgi:hypothetical protein
MKRKRAARKYRLKLNKEERCAASGEWASVNTQETKHYTQLKVTI